MLLAAGLEGIEQKLDPGEPHMENLYECSNAELTQKGISTLPRTLLEAVEALEFDPLAEKVMGSLMFNTFSSFKRQEWEQYHNHVSDWELNRYLKFF